MGNVFLPVELRPHARAESMACSGDRHSKGIYGVCLGGPDKLWSCDGPQLFRWAALLSHSLSDEADRGLRHPCRRHVWPGDDGGGALTMDSLSGAWCAADPLCRYRGRFRGRAAPVAAPAPQKPTLVPVTRLFLHSVAEIRAEDSVSEDKRISGILHKFD